MLLLKQLAMMIHDMEAHYEISKEASQKLLNKIYEKTDTEQNNKGQNERDEVL